MVIQVDKYLVEIEENSILVLPATSKARHKEPQLATFAELYSLKPQYVREAVARRIRHIGFVYMYHFDRPYPAGRRPQHYVGFARNVQKRELRHLAGNGSRLLQVVAEKGINWRLAKVWVGDRYFERKLKREAHYHRHCPFCNHKDLIEVTAREMLDL